jgi:hypothetical protein
MTGVGHEPADPIIGNIHSQREYQKSNDLGSPKGGTISARITNERRATFGIYNEQ